MEARCAANGGYCGMAAYWSNTGSPDAVKTEGGLQVAQLARCAMLMPTVSAAP